MSSALVYSAIKARLVDTLGGTYPIRDWEEIETALQRETAPWISIEDGDGQNELNSVGSPDSNWVTDTGFIDVNVMVPVQGGLSPARSIAEQVRDVLLYQHLNLTEGRLRVRSVEPPATGYVHNGLWHSMRVSLNYEHQYVRATAA
jgi:hypothetical protein